MLRQRRAILVGAAVVTLVLLAAFCVWSFRDRAGRSATATDAAVRDLPPDAVDIRWFLPGASGPNVLYDFAVSQDSFQKWVDERDDRARFRGPRFGRCIVLTYDETTDDFKKLELPNTVSYSWTEEDTGVLLIYDRDAKRAYVHSHSR